jgi:hypothetical protein
MKLKLILGLLISALTLSGCGGIPNSSEVYFGEVISEDTSTQFVRVIARPPSIGMTTEEIIRGFLAACADPAEDYEIARQYLVTTSASLWKPEAGIDIYDATTLRVSGTEPGLVATAATQGSISDLGKYTSADPGAQILSDFELVRELSGEWRISKLADGILLSSGDVDRSFRSFPIYFFNTSLTTLVTDSLLVPVSNSGAATSLVRSLLAGPSPYLAPVATTAFPVGTTLTYGSVPIINGVAQVDLSSEILGADELTRRAMSAQLVWTLSALANVSGVQISVSGQPFVLSDIAPIQTTNDWERLSPLPDAQKLSMNVFRNEKLLAIKHGTEVVRAVAPTALVLGSGSPDSSKIAAVTADLKSLIVAPVDSLSFTVVAQGENLSRPTWDNSGRIFYADFGQGIREIAEDGTARIVAADVSRLGTTQQIKQIEIASDGVRVALVYSDGVNDSIALGAIFRTDSQTRVIGIRRIEQTINQVRDIVWKTPTSIAALASDPTGGELFFDISLNDGKVATRSSLTGARTLGVDGSGNIYAGVVDGSKQLIYRLNPTSWSEIAQGTGVFFTR